MKHLLWLLCLTALISNGATAEIDQQHKAWDQLLRKYVVVASGGSASQVRYAEFAQDRGALGNYLTALSQVSESEFKVWSKSRQMAYLINAYNAFTVEKVLTRYPNLKSIRDFGIVFGNPWKDRFFNLFGHPSSLERIEDMLRAKGAYEDPRAHFALNCASIGCPMLRAEAYVAELLDAQLEDQARRFLFDRSRNRYDPGKRTLEVSKIFDWFKQDWTSGYKGIGKDGHAIASREQYFARYASLLADQPDDQSLIAGQKVGIAFLEYDWTLNDVK
jgi:hypothetical protein